MGWQEVQAPDGVHQKTIENNRCFCFQEVWRSMARRKIVDGCRTHLFDEIAALFGSRFVGCYSSRQEGIALSGPVGFDLSFGQGIFWRKSLSCDPIKDLFLFRSKDSLFDDLPILPSVNRSDLKAVTRARRAQWKKSSSATFPHSHRLYKSMTHDPERN